MPKNAKAESNLPISLILYNYRALTELFKDSEALQRASKQHAVRSTADAGITSTSTLKAAFE